MMKKIILSLLSLMVASHLLAQTPQAINYQTVVRDNGGAALANQNISFRLSILDSVTAVSTVYSETHNVRTNAYGLATLMIGRGTNVMGSFSAINWAIGTKFLRVEADLNQSGSYTNLGTQQFLSVPYALYAERAGNGVSGGNTNGWLTTGNNASSNSLLGTTNTQNLNFITNGIQRAVLTTDGKMGIGTNNPKGYLDIEYNASGFEAVDARSTLRIFNNSSGEAAQAAILLQSYSRNTETALSHVSPNYNVVDEFADFGQLRSSGSGLVLQAPYGIIKFQTGINGNPRIAVNERMRIALNGNVGIGTKNPTTKLEVSDGDVFVSNPNNGIILKSPNGNCWRVTIDNNGNFIRTAIACPL